MPASIAPPLMSVRALRYDLTQMGLTGVSATSGTQSKRVRK